MQQCPTCQHYTLPVNTVQEISDMADFKAGVRISPAIENILQRDRTPGSAGRVKEDFTPGSETYQAFERNETPQTYLQITYSADWYPDIAIKRRRLPELDGLDCWSREYALITEANGGSPYVQ